MFRSYTQLGAGGTGSHLYPALITYLNNHHRNEGTDFTLYVIDGDHFEIKNAERQLFQPGQLNQNKAEAVVANMPDKRVVAIPEYLDPNQLSTKVQDDDVVILTVDNFPIRAAIEKHALTLDNITIINGGNELNTGSCQAFVRRDGKNHTPPISFEHAEILRPGATRADMSCQEVAELPSGEQTLIANMQSATLILQALAAIHSWEQARLDWYHTEPNEIDPPQLPWHEVHFDTTTGKMRPTDLRGIDGWADYTQPTFADISSVPTEAAP